MDPQPSPEDIRPDVTRPRLLPLAAIPMAIMAVLAISAGLLALGSGVLFIEFYRTMGGRINPIVLASMAIGAAAIFIGILNGIAAWRILSGDRWARRIGLTLAILFVLLGSFMIFASIAARVSTEFWPLILAANAFVMFVLIRAGGWFAMSAARRPDVPRAPIVRRLAPWLAVAAGIIAVVATLGIKLQVGGDDRPLRYLQALPEYGLAFPGATRTSVHDAAQDSWFEDSYSASTNHRYSAQAPAQEVTAWYVERLASGGWERSDLRQNSPDADVPQWKRAYESLQLWYARPDPNGATTFTVTLVAEDIGVHWAPLYSLQALPASRLIYPGSTVGPSTDAGRTTSDSRIQPAGISRNFETPASIVEVVRYFETELAAQGWLPREVTAPAVGWKWAIGDSLLHLFAHVDKSSPQVTKYRYQIEEVVGPEVTPGLPWR